MITGPVVPDRYALNWLLVASAWVLAPLLARVPAWMAAAVVCLLVWRYLAAHHGWPLPGRITRMVVAAALVLAVFKVHGTVLGRDAGITLLVGLLGLKLWELQGLRDYVLVVFLLYVLILASFLYSQNAWLAVYMMGAVVLLTAVLFRLQQPTGAAVAERVRLAAGLVLKAAPLMVVLYLLFPRIPSGGLWGLPTDAYGGITGMSDMLQMGAFSQVSESTAVAFRVEPASHLPPASERYWRQLVLEHTDGRTWTRATNGSASADAAHALGDPVSYTVTLEPTNQPWLVALDLPLMPPSQATWQPGFVLATNTAVRARLRYSLASSPRYVTDGVSPGDLARDLVLPANVSARVRALATRWRDEHGTPDAIADAALRFFHDQGFVYTLQPPPLGDDPIDEFLFDTRQGFCEHYAAAFTVLMRAAGIPARIVLGYQGGEVNRTGDYLIVRQSDAHAWSEIWLAERGWVRVDPTSAVAPERIELGMDAVRRMQQRGIRPGELPERALLSAIAPNAIARVWHGAGLLWDAANQAWNQWVFDYSPARQRAFLAWLGFRAPSWATMVATLAAVAALIVLLLAALMLYTRPTQDPAQAAFGVFCRKLARIGLARRKHEGPLAYAERCARVRPDLAGDIRIIARLYTELRYAARGGPPALLALRHRVRTFRPQRTASLTDTERREDAA
jgi:transglutaminase-like putative cysteine protease